MPQEEQGLVRWGHEHLATLLEHYGQPRDGKDDIVFEPVVDAEVLTGCHCKTTVAYYCVS